MKKQEFNILSNLLKTGMPLSYFAKIEPFNKWFGLMTKKDEKSKLKKGDKLRKETVQKPIPIEETSKHWTENVYLDKFQTKEIQKGIFKGCYEIYAEFSAYQKIVISLPNPKGTAAIFGREIKENEKAEKLKIKFTLDSKAGFWRRIEIYGDLKFRLSENLVTQVIEKNYQWKATTNQHIEVPLSGSKITLSRGAAPKLSDPLILPDISIRIAQSNLVAKISSLDLGGTVRKPKIIFNNIKLQHITKQ